MSASLPAIGSKKAKGDSGGGRPRGGYDVRLKDKHLAAREASVGKSKWVQKYRVGREEREAFREKARHAEAELTRIYIEKQTALKHPDAVAPKDAVEHVKHHKTMIKMAPSYRKLPPVTMSQAIPREIWKGVWGHNKLCEISGLPCTSTLKHKRCIFCPVVVRMEYIPSKQIRKKRWVCNDCNNDVQANKAILDRDRAKLQMTLDREHSAQMIQSRWRGRHERLTYNTALRGIKRISAAARGKWSRRKFVNNWKAKRHPFRIKVLSASGLKCSDSDGFSDPFCVVAVCNGSDSEHQQFRFDGKTVNDTLNPTFTDDPYLVPGADGNVIITVTVIDFDELRNDFLGQAVLRMAELNFVGLKLEFELPLENMLIPIKENNRTAMRLGCSDVKGQGKVKIQLQPCSVATSFCGFLEEKANAMSMASSKKWWALLVDGHLRLYQFYGASKEKVCLNLKKAHKVVVHDKAFKEEGVDKPPIPPHLVITMPDRLWTLQAVGGGGGKDVSRWSPDEHKHWRVTLMRSGLSNISVVGGENHKDLHSVLHAHPEHH
jgi:hypothetical protein